MGTSVVETGQKILSHELFDFNIDLIGEIKQKHGEQFPILSDINRVEMDGVQKLVELFI